MGKYTDLQENVFAIFGSNAWKAENIKTIPVNFLGTQVSGEFIRVSVIPSGPGINLLSISGLLIIDIFTKAGNGPTRSFAIADVLDLYLVGQNLTPYSNVAIQFQNSAFQSNGLDTDNPSLFRSTYTIPFIYTEVQ
jgi:hypothetical protein